VAWAGAADDAVVVVTNLGLWLPSSAGRLGWHEIHKAIWSGRTLHVVPSHEVGTADGYVETADLATVSVTLLDPDRVPDQVRTRVLRSVAYTSHHALPGGGGVRVVARRVPGRDGLRWTVRADAGTSLAEASLAEASHAEAVAELVSRARAQISGGESVVRGG
jgi:hypothetical protein